MKKIILNVVLLASLLMISACGASQAKIETKESQTTQVSKEKATISVFQEKKEITSKAVTFKAGENLMTVLKENFEVKDEKGMISEVEGITQDKEKGYYWTYKINGKMVETGAKDTILKNHDKVVLAYDKF